MPTFSMFITSQRGAEQLLDSDGYIYWRKKSPHLYMEMFEVQSPDGVQVPLHCYLYMSGHTLTLEPSPKTTLRMEALLLDRKSLPCLPPAPLPGEMSSSSSTTERLTEEFVLLVSDIGIISTESWWIRTSPAPRTQWTVEGFHRGFKTRVNRRTPSFRSMSEQSRESRS